MIPIVIESSTKNKRQMALVLDLILSLAEENESTLILLILIDTCINWVDNSFSGKEKISKTIKIAEMPPKRMKISYE
jgi:hypothetical protein